MRFTFDHVLGPETTQEEAYIHTAKPMIPEIMKGYNVTVFSYGQTGTGKTHSMIGSLTDDTLKGISPRLIENIFREIDCSDPNIEFTVKASYVEIYNEKIRDLMDISKDNLRIREGATGVWIEDVTQVYVRNAEEVYEVMNDGNKNRSVAATKMNAESSRSHSVFIITVGQKDTSTGSIKGAKVTLVDLAGSEKVGKTGADGQTLKEAQHINKSLSALGNVINALTTVPAKGQKVHIPYRDSKLTYLLSDSLGGNSKTCLIITGSPSAYNAEETISTMRFGNRAKSIKNKPKMNQEKSVAEYQRLLNAANAKISLLEGSSKVFEAEIGTLRMLVCMLDPAFNQLYNKTSVIDMLTNVHLRNSIAKMAQLKQGHPAWQAYYRADLDQSSAAADPSSMGLTIEDIMNSMDNDTESGTGSTVASLPTSPTVVSPSAASTQAQAQAQAQAQTQTQTEGEGEGEADEPEASPFGYDSDSDKDEDGTSTEEAKKEDGNDTYTDVVSAYGDKGGQRDTGVSFAQKSRELLDINAKLEEEVAILREQTTALREQLTSTEVHIEELQEKLKVQTEEHATQLHKHALEHTNQLHLEAQKYSTMLQELKTELQTAQSEKSDVESLLDTKTKQLKMHAQDMAMLQEKLAALELQNQQTETLLAKIKDRHGDGILSDLESSEITVNLNSVKQTQAEILQLRQEQVKIQNLVANYKSTIISLTGSYQHKCSQLNQAQITLSACKSHIESLEQQLLTQLHHASTLEQLYKEDMAKMDKQLQATQTMIEQLYESGNYWRGQGVGNKYTHGSKIVVPVIKNDQGNTTPGRKRGSVSTKHPVTVTNAKNTSNMSAFF